MWIESEEWGKEFIKSRSAEQRQVLKAKLRNLTATYPGMNGRGLRHAWIRLGAACWPRSANLRKTIELWAKALE